MADATEIGIVGCGQMGARHAWGYAALQPDVRLRLVDIDARRSSRLAERLTRAGVSTGVTSWDDLIGAGRRVAVDLCTPPAAHAGQALAALRHGHPTLCEKPLAIAGDEEAALALAARRSAGWLAVVYPYRHHPALRWAGRMLSQRALGAPVQAHLRLGVRGGGRPWRHLHGPAGGGVANEVLCHLIDLALGYFGPAREGRLLTGGILWPRRREGLRIIRATAADFALLELRHAVGTRSLLAADMASPGYWQSLEVEGRQGTLWASVVASHPSVLRSARGEQRIEHAAVDMLGAVLQAFLQALRAGRPAPELLPRQGVANWLSLAQGGLADG